MTAFVQKEPCAWWKPKVDHNSHWWRECMKCHEGVSTLYRVPGPRTSGGPRYRAAQYDEFCLACFIRTHTERCGCSNAETWELGLAIELLKKSE